MFLAVIAGAGCQHQVRIDSDPAGVRVTELKQGYLGTTGSRPLDVTVKDGASLDLTFEKSGYDPLKRSLQNISHDRQLFVELYRRGTVLAVVTNPPGAELEFFDEEGKPMRFRNTVDPTSVQQFAKQRFLVPSGVGKVEVEIRKPGFETLRETLPLFEGQENRFSFVLEEKFSTFSIRTEPTGARVTEKYFNYLGTTPIDGFELSLSRMRHVFPNRSLRDIRSVDLELEISKRGYETVRTVHRVFLHEPNEPLVVRLQPKQ